MSATTLLSVVIPIFNGASYLQEAIESVLAQSYRPMEIIVIDDGSTDDSAKIAKSFKKILYKHQQNKGPSSARNLGVALANGAYIGFHDADDICLPNRLQDQMDILLNNKQLEVVFSRIQNFLDKSTEVPTYLQTDDLMKPRMGFISSAVMRKSVFEKVGGFNEDLRLGEDIEWMIRAEEKHIRSSSLIDILVQRRLHDKNLSNDLSTGHKNLAKILLAKINRRKPALPSSSYQPPSHLK